MNNTVYGKTMENLRNWSDVRLVNNKKDYLKWTLKPGSITQNIFARDLVAIHKTKTIVTLSNQAYVGMCISGLSKIPMYEFHFCYIKSKYGNKLRLLFTDIDSLKYETKTEGVSVDFNKNKEISDFSNYSAESKYYYDSNMLVVGKMKDEIDGIDMKEFACLRPKMYSILVRDFKRSKKAKVVNKNVVAKINQNEYKDFCWIQMFKTFSE